MQAYLSLGSNLESRAGDPRATVLAAAARLARLPETEGFRLSRIYRSSPWGPVAQPDFANAVAWIEWRRGARELLAAAQALEEGFGRARQQRFGPRTLDIDLLLFGSEIQALPNLELPHPRLHLRRFVLVPLAELCPELRHPVLGASIATLCDRLVDPGCVELWEAAA